MGKYLISDIMPAGRKKKAATEGSHGAEHAAHKKPGVQHRASAAAPHEKHAVAHRVTHPRTHAAEPAAPIPAAPAALPEEHTEVASGIAQDGVMYTHATSEAPVISHEGTYPYNLASEPHEESAYEAPDGEGAHASGVAHEEPDEEEDVQEGSHSGMIFNRASMPSDRPMTEPIDADRAFDMDDASSPYGGTGTPTRTYGESGGGWKALAPFAIGIIVLGVVVLIGGEFFARATITVVPKTHAVTVEQKMKAVKEPGADDLGFSVMAVDLEESLEIPATGSKTVTAKASGKIIIYNNFSSKSQRLIKNTRFQSPTGKIYRISESVNIPGQKVEGGKTVPGSVEVTVYADEAGPEYNTEPTDFKIPGLKGDPRYDSVYARSKGPIEGGASGTVSTVSDEDLKRAKDDLRVALETKLRMKARGDVAPTQIAFDTGIFVELKQPEVAGAGATKDTARVVQTGTIYIVLFDRAALSRTLARSQVPGYTGEQVTIDKLDALLFEPAIKTGKEVWDTTELTFTLKGPIRFSWTVDEEKVKTEVAGTPRTNFNAIMEAYPNVDQANASVKPFWKRSFPDETEKITIKLLDAEQTDAPVAPSESSVPDEENTDPALKQGAPVDQPRE